MYDEWWPPYYFYLAHAFEAMVSSIGAGLGGGGGVLGPGADRCGRILAGDWQGNAQIKEQADTISFKPWRC